MLKKNLKIIVTIGIVCAIVAILITYALVAPKPKSAEPTIIINQEPQKEVLRRKIDGQEIQSEAEANLYPVAIMVENSEEAWPLSGLDKANIVIEAITESSIPRFVAIFANNSEIKKIGPVRSARPYYLDWINPYAPLYMHVGGAPEAIKTIRSNNLELVDFDQFFNGDYYWRDTKWRYAPHNVYTSSELIQKALAKKELKDPADYQMWKYKNDLELEKRPENAVDITILYSNAYYKVAWKYNREENNYIRYQDGDLEKMLDGEWIKAKNVIVQVNDMKVIDAVGRKNITTIGEGKAWIFRDGATIEGKWVQGTKAARIRYYDNQGNEIEFNGGTTWVEVIPEEDYLRY